MSHAPTGGLGPGQQLGGEQTTFPVAGASSRTWDAYRALRRSLLPYARYAVLIVTGLLATTLCIQILRYERDIATVALDWRSIALVAAFVFFLASAAALATRRRLAPIALACGVMVLLTIVSVVKYKHVRASLYMADFYEYATLEDLISLYTLFPKQLFVGLATLVLFAALMGLLFLIDDTRILRRRAAVVLALSTVCLVSAFSWRGPQGKLYHFYAGHHVSAPIASGPEALWQGGFLDAADRGGRIDSEPIIRLQNASAGEAPPTVITILHESSFPTEIFPIQCGGRVPNALYTSSNGNRYELRVETFNGATWMTEYGLLLGLSTYYLGNNRIWVGHSMENKFRDGLVHQMQRNGYKTIALYPTPKTFVNTGRFYNSIGFDKFLDYYDLRATSEYERDRFYFAKAIEQIRMHKASGSRRPLFLFLWINAPHAPYDYVSHPGVAPDPEAVCAKDPLWAEYIRRLLMSEDDVAWFHEALKAAFPDEPFMLLGYGDHHPYLSEEFLEPSPSDPFTPVGGSIGYKTFFRITGVNYRPDWSVVPKSVDTPFLGNVLMQAARLPRHGFYVDRDKLMELCGGRYSDCPEQDEILSFHDRLIRSSSVVNR